MQFFLNIKILINYKFITTFEHDFNIFFTKNLLFKYIQLYTNYLNTKI